MVGLRQAVGAPNHRPECEKDTCEEWVEMKVRDVIPLHEASTHAVVLISTDRRLVLPIFVDEISAVTIALRLTHQSAPQPLSADVLEKVVEELGGRVTEVRIEDVQNQLYRARIFIRQGNRRFDLSAQPSELIAVALGRGAKIFASTKVLSQAGITAEEIRQHELGAEEEGPGVGG